MIFNFELYVSSSSRMDFSTRCLPIHPRTWLCAPREYAYSSSGSSTSCPCGRWASVSPRILPRCLSGSASTGSGLSRARTWVVWWVLFWAWHARTALKLKTNCCYKKWSMECLRLVKTVVNKYDKLKFSSNWSCPWTFSPWIWCPSSWKRA